MTAPDLHQIGLGPNAVSEALNLVEAFAAAERLESSAALAVIVEELVCNLVDHGRRDDTAMIGSGVVGIGLSRGDDGVRLTLTDDCVPFDPRGAEPAGDLPPDRGGGAGLALVRAWSRILSYSRTGDRNRLELIVPTA